MKEPAYVLRIKAATRRDESIIRLGGDASGYATTWLSDDRQLIAACDGCGWPEVPKTRYLCSRLFALEGDPLGAELREIESYPEIPMWAYLEGALPPYYSLAMLAVDGQVYQYLST